MAYNLSDSANLVASNYSMYNVVEPDKRLSRPSAAVRFSGANDNQIDLKTLDLNIARDFGREWAINHTEQALVHATQAFFANDMEGYRYWQRIVHDLDLQTMAEQSQPTPVTCPTMIWSAPTRTIGKFS